MSTFVKFTLRYIKAAHTVDCTSIGLNERQHICPMAILINNVTGRIHGMIGGTDKSI